MIHSGETLSLQMCGVSGKSVELQIKGSAPEELEEECCGECAMPALLEAGEPVSLRPVIALYVTLAAKAQNQISPRSPLWPGAPPQGPPHTHIA